jgi:hypothetical protein
MKAVTIRETATLHHQLEKVMSTASSLACSASTPGRGTPSSAKKRSVTWSAMPGFESRDPSRTPGSGFGDYDINYNQDGNGNGLNYDPDDVDGGSQPPTPTDATPKFALLLAIWMMTRSVGSLPSLPRKTTPRSVRYRRNAI